MKLSTRTRYGLRALLELAKNYGKGPLQLKVIAKQQDISVKYLEQLMAVLKLAGIVKSVRGPSGGYVLSKNPGELKLGECFNCLEGKSITPECVYDKNLCSKSDNCTVRGLWVDLQNTVTEFFQSITMQSLIDRGNDRKAPDYQI